MWVFIGNLAIVYCFFGLIATDYFWLEDFEKNAIIASIANIKEDKAINVVKIGGKSLYQQKVELTWKNIVEPQKSTKLVI